jgi:hypothetical protein
MEGRDSERGETTIHGQCVTACLRLVGKKLLVALTMEGKFAGEGLQSIDEDDDMLSAMARELVERNGIGETADAVWKALNTEHRKLFRRLRVPTAILLQATIGTYLSRPTSAQRVWWNQRFTPPLSFLLDIGRKHC